MAVVFILQFNAASLQKAGSISPLRLSGVFHLTKLVLSGENT
jgi:hypothetical protein